MLSWTPPANNGAEITGYLVSSTAGDYEKQCAATTCTLDGLTNNVEYNFTVIAENRVGRSDPSAPSETARPDARPDTPAAADAGLRRPEPQRRVGHADDARFAGRELHPRDLAGAAVGHRAEDRCHGQLDRVGRPRRTASRTRCACRRTTARPTRRAGAPWSVTEIPARAPDAPAAPTTARLQPVGAQAQLQVSWNAPADNGDAIAGYQLRRAAAAAPSSARSRVSAGQTSQAVVVDTSTTDYTFRVRAQNKAGWGAFSATSAPRRAFAPPGAPTNVGRDAGRNSSLTVTLQPGRRQRRERRRAALPVLAQRRRLAGDCPATTSSAGSRTARPTRCACAPSPPSTASATTAPRRRRRTSVMPYGPVRNPERRRRRERAAHHLQLERARPRTAAPSRGCRSASTAAAGRTSRAERLARPTTTATARRHTHRGARAGCRRPVERRRVGLRDDGRSAAGRPWGRRARRQGQDNCSPDVRVLPACTPRTSPPATTASTAASGLRRFADGGGARVHPRERHGPARLLLRRHSAQRCGSRSTAGATSTATLALASAPNPHRSRKGTKHMTMTPEQAAWFQGTFARLVDNVDQALLGKREVVGARAVRDARRGPRAARGRPRHRQDEPREGARRHGAGHEQPHPVHARPAAVRRHGRHDLRPGAAPVRVPPRARSSPRSCSPTRSTAPRRRRSRRCSRSWRSRASPSTASPHDVGRPFIVIATQNPIEQAGTYKLPEAQLDRFLIKTSIGYPDLAVAERILAGAVRPQPVGAPARDHHDRRRRRHGRPRARPCTSSRPCCATPRSWPRRRATTPRPASASRCAARSR